MVAMVVVVIVKQVMVQELHRWGDWREQRLIAQDIRCRRDIADGHDCRLSDTNGLLLLPDKDIVNDRSATEHDSQSNQDTCDDRRCRLELCEGVQDYSWERGEDGLIEVVGGFIKYNFTYQSGILEWR